MVATEYAKLNGKAGDIVVPPIVLDDTQITVTIRRTVTLFFGKFFSLISKEITGTATAVNKVIYQISGVAPLAVEKQNFVYGKLYTLKDGGGAGSNGNYGALAFGGRGASNYRNNLKYGYDEKIHVGQWVDTEPGNMSGPTVEGVNYRISLDPAATFQTVNKNSPRVLTVPIVDSLDIKGRGEVQIVGFAAFFLEGVGGSGKDNYVTGRFLRKMTLGDTTEGSEPVDFGLRCVKIVN
jgi:hypothetical protein